MPDGKNNGPARIPPSPKGDGPLRESLWTTEYLRAEGGFVRIGKDIHIPARNNFYVQIDFSSEAYRALQAIKDVVGPGCGWARVKVTLDGILTRAVI